MSKYIYLGLLVILMGGCSTINIQGKSDYDKSNILVKDHRNPESKVEKRASVFSAIAFIGEDKIHPRALDVYITDLAKHLTNASKHVIDVNDFLVFDYFPSRMSGIENDGLIGYLLVAPKEESDQQYLDRFDLKKNIDSIICIFSGAVDGKHVLSVNQEPYKVALSTIMIRNDPDFRRAISDCLSGLAVETYDRFKGL